VSNAADAATTIPMRSPLPRLCIVELISLLVHVCRYALPDFSRDESGRITMPGAPSAYFNRCAAAAAAAAAVLIRFMRFTVHYVYFVRASSCQEHL
jgi:hypothetical protein